ncbi:uncharacterized protein SCHCODRAFT_02038818 [Schizophyllum commune H4-8]|uniref:uncharacterized protein n=1 Tax=Schizophyllum commune (strain H4-8 / FGSC 9210) TaxID=578458 RepID=UPI00215EBF9C|nr:uncharacterized protein SCHCODRAFT_02038818 [Schizophyllum commune H4-8]KAI5900540.1 hypothetical protein SCHCODRAFT_02038818 [Schizophyllum commune H4-8]
MRRLGCVRSTVLTRRHHSTAEYWRSMMLVLLALERTLGISDCLASYSPLIFALAMQHDRQSSHAPIIPCRLHIAGKRATENCRFCG